MNSLNDNIQLKNSIKTLITEYSINDIDLSTTDHQTKFNINLDINDNPSSSLYIRHKGTLTPALIKSDDKTKHEPLIFGSWIYVKLK